MIATRVRPLLLPLVLAAGLGACASNAVQPGIVSSSAPVYGSPSNVPPPGAPTQVAYSTPVGGPGRVVSIREVGLAGRQEHARIARGRREFRLGVDLCRDAHPLQQLREIDAARTAMAVADLAITASDPATMPPEASSVSVTARLRISASAFSPACSRFRSRGAVAQVTSSLQPFACSKLGISGSTTPWTAMALKSFMRTPVGRRRRSIRHSPRRPCARVRCVRPS